MKPCVRRRRESRACSRVKPAPPPHRHPLFLVYRCTCTLLPHLSPCPGRSFPLSALLPAALSLFSRFATHAFQGHGSSFQSGCRRCLVQSERVMGHSHEEGLMEEDHYNNDNRFCAADLNRNAAHYPSALPRRHTHKHTKTMTALLFTLCRLLASRPPPGAAGTRYRRPASQPPLPLARRSSPSLALARRRSNTSSNNNSGGAWQIDIARHVMRCNSTNERSKPVSMTWRAVSTRP